MLVEEFLNKWRDLEGVTPMPPADDILLWRNASGVVYLANQWGPAIPYSPIDHEDGTQNYGYVRLKENLDILDRIPEVEGFPEYKAFIASINSAASPIESVGCEKGFFPVEDNPPVTTYIGSYTDVIFSDPQLNDNPDNLLKLAAYLCEAVEGCEQWCGNVELGLQRLKHLDGASTPWGLMIRVTNYGRDEAEARKYWSVTLSKLAAAIESLPSQGEGQSD